MNTPRDLAIPIQRITWRDGQTLTCRDLRDDQSNIDRLRHLHIHYLHRTWGVVEGLNVRATGRTAVAVSPGYALDIEGRELLLPSPMRISTPANIAARTTMYLVFSQVAPSMCCAAPPDLATLCPGVQAASLLEEGILSWKSVNEVRLGYDVLLARVLIVDGNLVSAVDTSIQRYATTMKQPRIWSDITPQGQTGWTDNTEQGLRELRASVDTSDAGFILTPAYFARPAGTGPSLAVTGFISSASANNFTFVMRAVGRHDQFSAAVAESAGWTIAWLAIELKDN